MDTNSNVSSSMILSDYSLFLEIQLQYVHYDIFILLSHVRNLESLNEICKTIKECFFILSSNT